MEIRLLTNAEDLAAYGRLVATHPQGSLWQSLEWKGYQEALGRETRVYAALEGSEIVASALVTIDRTSFHLSTWDCPRGPLWTDTHAAAALLDRIKTDATQDRCLTLYLSPLQPLQDSGFKTQDSSRHEQPEATRILDLTLSEEDLLKQMHPKGRYNIGVARKHGVRVEASKDASAFHELLSVTGARDGFRVASQRHYETFLNSLPGSFLLLARHAGSHGPVAGLMGVTWGKTAIYYYGASSYEHRALMAPYLLQWEAMAHGKAAGCTSYDLLGVAPPDAGEDHPWKGITSFKEKFGGALITYPPEQHLTLRPAAKRLLGIKRKILG